MQSCQSSSDQSTVASTAPSLNRQDEPSIASGGSSSARVDNQTVVQDEWSEHRWHLALEDWVYKEALAHLSERQIQEILEGLIFV